MKKHTLFLTLFLASFLTGYPQVSEILWSKTYGGSQRDEANEIQQTSDGGYVIAATTFSNDGDVSGFHGESDGWIVKLDSTGQLSWSKVYGGTNKEEVKSIQQTNDGGYIAAGWTHSNDGDINGNHGGEDAWIIRLDAAGDTLWSKLYGGSDSDRAYRIRPTEDGGYIVAGSSLSSDHDVPANNGVDDAWVFKIDSNGNLIWSFNYGGSCHDAAEDIQQTIDGGYVVVAYSSSHNGDVPEDGGGGLVPDFWMFKLDSDGIIEWSTAYGDSNDWEEPFAIQQTMDKGYVVAGWTETGTGWYDCLVIKLDTSGNVIWNRTYGESQHEEAHAIQQTADSGFIIAGCTSSPEHAVKGIFDTWIVKTDKDANLLWSKAYGGSDSENVRSISLTNDNGYVVTGTSGSNDGDVPENKGSYDLWVFKLWSDTLVSKTFGGSKSDGLNSMVNTNDGGYLLVGSSESGDGDVQREYDGTDDGWVVKLNACLDTTWTKSFDYGWSALDVYFKAVDKTHDGGYIIAGQYYYYDFKNEFVFEGVRISKLDSIGNINWEKGFGGTEYDYVSAIRQTPDSGFVFIGSSYSSDGDVPANQGARDYWVVKLNASGDIIFSKTFGGTQNDYGLDVCPINNDGYVVVGETRSQDADVHGNHGYYDAWILRLDANGDTIWTKCLGGTGSDKLRSIVSMHDGNYLVTGYSTSDDGDLNENYGGSDCWVIKVNDNGDIVWSNNYGGTSSDQGSSIQLYSEGMCLVAGSSASDDIDVPLNKGDKDLWFLLINEDGEICASKTFGGTLYDGAETVVSARNSNIVIAGNSYSSDGDVPMNRGGSDFWVIKFETDPCFTNIPVQLPFHEDWETQNGIIQTNGNIYTGIGYSWEFETDNPNEGRLRWGTNAFQANDGNGAITIDKHPNDGDYATNKVILTLNLSDYTSSTSLELSFWWADHNDEKHAEDKVWIRGGTDDPWVEIYDLDPSSATDHVYQQVSGLDIDAALSAASQNVAGTFQVRFGQKDNSFAPGDGLSFDDITITGDRQPIILPFLEEWETSSGTRKTDGTIYKGENHQWTFETDTPEEGRARWGTDAYQVYQGAGALTLDKHPNTGTYAVNNAILTLDLSRYTYSTDLLLSFWWADHADEDQAEDKVWIRGGDTESWVEIYDLDPATTADHEYQQVTGLDIDATLTGASQTVSSTFQLRFGQRDNSFAPGDGLSFDNILVEQQYAYEPPFAENFDSSLEVPESWSVIRTAPPSGVWPDKNNASSFPNSLVIDTYTTQKTILISPCLIGLCKNGGLIEFSAKKSGGDSKIEFLVGTMSQPTDENTFIALDTIRLNDFHERKTMIIDPGSASGSYVAFHLTVVEGYTTNVYFDDFYYDEIPACLWPVDQKATKVSSSSADLNWIEMGNATGWEIVIDTSGSQVDTTASQIVSTNPFTITGLLADVEYDWHIRSCCDESYKSDWKGPFTFRTNCSEEFSAPLYEDFSTTENGGIPPCWRSINTNLQGFSIGSYGYGLIMDIGGGYYAYGPLILISPQLDDLTDQDKQLRVIASGGGDSDFFHTYPTLSIGTMKDPHDPGTYTEYVNLSITNVLSEYTIKFDTGYHLADRYLAIKSGPAVYEKYVCYSETFIGEIFYEMVDDSLYPIELPYLEGWESQNGLIQTDGIIYLGTGYKWEYANDNPNEGRLRYGTNAYQVHDGSGAMTLDKFPNDGDYATNYVTLNLNLANYTTSTDLELSFWWADHADEEHAEDKVWIRGSDADAWVEIYNLDPAAVPNGTYQFVSGLDIDAILMGASQAVGSTFQLRFGQKDNSFTPGDGLSFDDITILESTSIPFTLPFIEDWESENGTTKTNGNVYSATGYSWDFQNDNPNEGRLRWGTNTYLAYEGSGAMTLDKHPNDGDYAVNLVTLTLNLSDYSTSTDLELSFWWADHADEDQAEDKVWIRGGDTDSWVEIYDLDPASNPNNTYSQVAGLDIDATLAGASQIVTGTFQIRFGQKDNSFAPGDGLSFDNIVVEEIVPPKMLLIGKDSDILEVYPNPFSRSTTISFRVPETRSTTLKVYDLRGNEIARLFEGIAEGATEYRFTFYGESNRNGVYTIHLQSGKDLHLVKKVLLNK